nr:zinc finger, CCHC-type [Tanacetum cinerariifolium]
MKMRPSISWQGDLLYGRRHGGCVLFNMLLACLNHCHAVVSWRGAIDVLECFRFKYCKGTVLRLIRIRDAFVTNVMVPSAILIYDVLKSINCWKGECEWFTYDILSFQKVGFNVSLPFENTAISAPEETLDAKVGETTNKKKKSTSMAMIFQTLPQDVLMQVAQYSTAKEVWDSIKVKYLGADLVQKALLRTLRSELETLRMKPNKKVLVRKLLNSVPKKFLPIVKTIEQYQYLDEMSFEEAVGRLTAFEEQIKSQDTLEANDQDKLLLGSSNKQSHSTGQGKKIQQRRQGKLEMEE